MRSRVRVAGHPVHPMLVMFPTAVFPLLLVLDVVPFLVETDAGYWAAGFWLAAVGLLSALAAAVPGFVDMRAVPDKTRAHRTAAWHAVVGTSIIVAYGAAVWTRLTMGVDGAGVFLALDAVGTLLVTAQGFLGGELVYRHHMGVKTVEEGGDPTPLVPPARAKPATAPAPDARRP